MAAWFLATGAKMTTREMAQKTGLSVRGARFLLCRLSRVVPICQLDGLWQAVDGKTGAPSPDRMEA